LSEIGLPSLASSKSLLFALEPWEKLHPPSSDNNFEEIPY
jgi:hypothetical protein